MCLQCGQSWASKAIGGQRLDGNPLSRPQPPQAGAEDSPFWWFAVQPRSATVVVGWHSALGSRVGQTRAEPSNRCSADYR